MIKKRLDSTSLKQVVKAYLEIDDVTDFLNSVYGNDLGELRKLNIVWSSLYDILELHAENKDVDSLIEKYEEEEDLNDE